MKYIVEIPHIYPPKVWTALDNKEIIQRAYDCHNFIYEKWSYDKAEESWGKDDIPEDLLLLLEQEDCVIEYGCEAYTEFVKGSESSDEFTCAVEIMSNDLNAFHILNENEALESAKGSSEFISGHQCMKAGAALSVLLDLEE